MKRGIRYIVLSVPLVFLLVALLATAWLLGTNQGARWLLHVVSRSLSVTAEAQSVTGSFYRGLRIEGMRASRPEGTVDIGEFILRWDPAMLLLGRLSLPELTGKKIEITDNRPEGKIPSELTWPNAGAILPHLNIRISKFTLEGLTYRRLRNKPVIIHRLTGDVRLNHGTLNVQKMIFATPQLRLEGEMTAGFSRPYLRIDTVLVPASSPAGLDRFSVNLIMLPARTSREAEGSVKISGMAGPAKRIEFESRVKLTSRSLVLNDLRLFRPDRKGDVRGQAEILFTAATPVVHGRLEFRNLDLEHELPLLSGISGSIHVDGTIQEYYGAVSVSKKGAGWRAGALNAAFRGTQGGIGLTLLRGRWLEGTIEGSAHAVWKDMVSADASLKVRGLNPAGIGPQWSGIVNMNMSGAVRMRAGKQPEGEISLVLLKSRVTGRSLTGEIKADFKKKNILIDRLELHGKGFDVNARGDLAEKIEVAARVSDLSVFNPALAGGIRINGWVRKSKTALSGAVEAAGKKILAYGAKAASFRVNGGLEDQKGSPFTLSVSVRDFTYNIMRADSAELDASGTMDKNTLHAVLHSSGYTIDAKAAGAYAAGGWQGKIIQLSGTDAKGHWSAVDPAEVLVSRQVVSVSPLVIRAGSDEELKLEGKIMKNPLSGTVSAEWRQIDISRANAWLSGVTVSGVSAGIISGKIMTDERFALNAAASVSKGQVRRRIQEGELKAELGKADLSLAWQGETLEAKVSLVFAQYGHIDAGLSSRLPARLPVAFNPDATVRASVKGQLRETGTISFLFPGLIQESRGQMGLDIRVEGTWRTPAVNGSLLVDKAGGYFPAAGIHVSDIRIEAQIEQDRIRVTSLRARSGTGTVQGKALVVMEGWRLLRYEGSLQGERFQALFLPQMRMVLNPKIEFHGTTEKITVRGEVRVPELLIYGPPKESPVQPSQDVVIVGSREEEKAGKVSMDIEIKVILGDRVIVKAEGADAQLGGDIVIAARSAKEITGRGEIKVTKGKYSAYGVGLEINRGRVLFAGGPVENPSLDILALKTVNEVKAGVLVTGTLRKPVVKLYSQPTMPDADILAYMVLGHPLGQDKEQGNYLMQAAGALLSAGQSVALQDQVKQRLGLDTIDIQSGGGNVSRSLVTIGKYLSSKLYISYGRALFTNENLFRLRYKFGKRWELESHSGQTSGADLYYTIQFD